MMGLLLTSGATLIVTRVRSRKLFCVYYSTVLTQQALFNAVFHVGATAAFRRYSPGLGTSLALFLPLWWLVTRLAMRDGLLTRRGLGLAIAIGGLLHGVAVAQQVFFVRR